MSTRRDLLRAALGAGAAAVVGATGAGCQRRPRIPDGELHDFGRARGHARIRDMRDLQALTSPSADVPRMRASVVVVGGGVAGLSAAWRLKRAGVDDVVILELDDVAGGTSQSGASKVTAFPWGAHYVVLPYADNRAFIALLDEMGALDGVDEKGDPRAREEFACREPEERHFRNGAFHEGLYPVSADGAGAGDETADERFQRERFTQELDAYARIIDNRGRRAFTIPRARCSDEGVLMELDKWSFAGWLDARGFTSWRIRWMCDYACRDDFGLDAAHTSAWAGLFYFCARRRGDGAGDRTVLTWPEGNGRIVSHLAHGARVLTGHVAVDVDTAADFASVTAFNGDAPVVIDADDVVVACPRHVAKHITRFWRAAPPDWFSSFTTSAWAVVQLHLASRPKSIGFPLAWDSVITDSASLGYVTATHQRGIDHGPTVLTWYRPLVDDDPERARKKLESLDRAAWADAALADLEVAHQDIRDVVVRADVGRHGHAMIRPVPGLFTRGALGIAQQQIGRVHFAHTDLSGIALCEEAFFHGVRAAEEILTRRDPKTVSLL